MDICLVLIGNLRLLYAKDPQDLDQILWPNRDMADTFSGGSKDGIQHSRSCGRNSHFANSRWPVAAGDQVDLHLGHFIDFQEGIVSEIVLNHGTILDFNRTF